jgi:hypothetical protein
MIRIVRETGNTRIMFMTKMYLKRLALLLLLGLPLRMVVADDLPKPFSFARYQVMMDRSPFAVATAVAPEATPNFAKDLYVANAAHTGEGDFVSLASTTNKDLKEYLNTKEPVDGYAISNIQWSEQVGETKVTIAKDGQFATLTFNEALLSQAIQNTAPQMPQPQQPGMIGRPVPSIPLPRPQLIPTPPPHVRPPIRRKVGPQNAHPQPQLPANDEPDE